MNADKQLKNIIIICIFLVCLILVTGIWGIYYINKITEVSWNDCLSISKNVNVQGE